MSLQPNENLYKKSTTTDSSLNHINNKLDQLLEIIQTQNCQISELRNEVSDLKKSHSDSTPASSSTNQSQLESPKIELRLTRLIEEYLSRYEREYGRKLDAFLMAR